MSGLPASFRRLPTQPEYRVAPRISLGVIRGFPAEVALAALGRPLQALIAVRLIAG